MSRPYYVAKQKLYELQQFNVVLTMRIASQETERVLPRNAMVTITDTAFENRDPVRPNKALNIALGVIIGLVVGVGLAFFIEYLDTSVKTIDDVERSLQVAVLGVIPQNVGLLLEEGTESPHAEAYRVLRTNRPVLAQGRQAEHHRGRQRGRWRRQVDDRLQPGHRFCPKRAARVVVDSDLRRPTLHKMLKVTNNLGLTNYLLRSRTRWRKSSRPPACPRWTSWRAASCPAVRWAF